MVEAVRSRGLYMMHGCSHVASLVQRATPLDVGSPLHRWLNYFCGIIDFDTLFLLQRLFPFLCSSFSTFVFHFETCEFIKHCRSSYIPSTSRSIPFTIVGTNPCYFFVLLSILCYFGWWLHFSTWVYLLHAKDEFFFLCLLVISLDDWFII